MKGLFIAATLFCGVLALLTGRAEALGAEMMAAGDAAVELGLETMTALLVSVRVSDRVEVHLCAAGDAPLEKLGEQFRDVQWERDEDGLQYVTRTLEKSGE